MRKLILTAIMLMGLAFSAEAQELKNAIGLRLGDNDGFGGEVSYQRWLNTKNRLEFDLGWRNSHYRHDVDINAIKLAGLYQWVWNIDGGFNWYAGVGGGLASWSYDAPPGFEGDDSGTAIFAAGDIGIEYNFDFPLQLSLDFRPELYFSSDDWREDSFGPDIGLGIRYRF